MKINQITSLADLDWVIEHLALHGDTDIFPNSIEFEFMKDRKRQVLERVSKIDFSQYKPISIIDVVIPKSKYGFRPAHLMYPFDTIIFTAAVLAVSEDLEKSRAKLADGRSSSYRVLKSDDDFSMFDKTKTYRAWLDAQQAAIWFDEKHSHAIITDISDFYQRIYHHRIENLLSDYSTNKNAQKLILFFLKSWRARQSFGLPVGGNASRILAELALLDTDSGLSPVLWTVS